MGHSTRDAPTLPWLTRNWMPLAVWGELVKQIIKAGSHGKKRRFSQVLCLQKTKSCLIFHFPGSEVACSLRHILAQELYGSCQYLSAAEIWLLWMSPLAAPVTILTRS